MQRDLTNLYISESYYRLLQTDPTDDRTVLDGTGSLVTYLAVSGTVDAYSFKGDGSQLTNISNAALSGGIVSSSTQTIQHLIGTNIISGSGQRSILGLATTDSPTFNNLVLTGDLTARQLIVSSSVISVTQSYSSGSTVFGNTLDDTHRFTGSLFLTGSSTFTGQQILQSTKVTSEYLLRAKGSGSGSQLAIGVSSDSNFGITNDILTYDGSAYGKYTLSANNIHFNVSSGAFSQLDALKIDGDGKTTIHQLFTDNFINTPGIENTDHNGFAKVNWHNGDGYFADVIVERAGISIDTGDGDTTYQWVFSNSGSLKLPTSASDGILNPDGSVWTASMAVTASYALNATFDSSSLATINSNIFTGNQIVNGNVFVDGTLTARTYVVSSSVVNYETISVSGSTRFGDTNDDTHLFTGSLFLTGSLSVTSGITGSLRGVATTASYVLNAVSSSFATNSMTASYYGGTVTSASFATNSMTASYVLSSVSSSFATNSLTASLATTASYALNSVTASYVLNSVSSSVSNNTNLFDGFGTNSFAKTGSNTFNANQVISGSLTITQNLTVFGSSSLTYVTASQLAVSTSFISVNVFEPAQRFGGLIVYDSGSSQSTASLAWDSLHNHWVYQNASDGGYSGGMFIAGPKNTGSLGQELTLTTNFVPKAQGGDHITDSNISDNGTIVSINSNTTITGSLLVTSGITGSLQGVATTASYYGGTVTSASFATNSMTASYVLNAVSSSFASTSVTASYVLNSVSSSFALTASYANNVSATASYSLQSLSSSFASTSLTASYYGGTVLSASFAQTASYLAGTIASASYALTASYVIGGAASSNVKGGYVSSGSFTGTPKISSVTFGSAFSDNNYTVTVTGEDMRLWSIESKTAAGFTINTNSNVDLTNSVYWIATTFSS